MSHMPSIRFRMFEFGLAVEAKCPVCSWRVTATDPELFDTVGTDVLDHVRECPARAVNGN